MNSRHSCSLSSSPHCWKFTPFRSYVRTAFPSSVSLSFLLIFSDYSWKPWQFLWGSFTTVNLVVKHKSYMRCSQVSSDMLKWSPQFRLKTRYTWIMLCYQITTECRALKSGPLCWKWSILKWVTTSHEDYYQIISSLFRPNPPIFIWKLQPPSWRKVFFYNFKYFV